MYAPLIISSSSQNVKSAGMGTYLTSQWVTPQKYQDPLGGAKVAVPAGWGTGLSGCGCGGTCGGCGDHKHGMGDVLSAPVNSVDAPTGGGFDLFNWLSQPGPGGYLDNFTMLFIIPAAVWGVSSYIRGGKRRKK
jgi:hypothetical protein